MKVLLTGAGGQVGLAIRRLASARRLELVALDSAQLDITDRDAVRGAMKRHRPSHVINAAAYTAVDRAEVDRDRAFAVNASGAGWLAEAAQTIGAQMIQLSTDYVFDGTASRPYRSDDAPNPINVYGESKLAGERAVMDASVGEGMVLRTAWVYSLDGQNFLTTMLRLMNERDEIDVVVDQIGAPTAARSVADATLQAATARISGVHHWVDAGETSWYGFAVAIQEKFSKRATVRPIRAADYPTAARRPAYSVLETSAALGITPLAWQRVLGEH